MKFETTILNNNGSWYVRLPPVYAKHLDLKDEDDTPVEAVIQDETNKKGQPFCSIWKKGT